MNGINQMDRESIFGELRQAIDNGSYLPEIDPRSKAVTVGTYSFGSGVLAKAFKEATEQATPAATV